MRLYLALLNLKQTIWLTLSAQCFPKQSKLLNISAQISISVFLTLGGRYCILFLRQSLLLLYGDSGYMSLTCGMMSGAYFQEIIQLGGSFQNIGRRKQQSYSSLVLLWRAQSRQLVISQKMVKNIEDYKRFEKEKLQPTAGQAEFEVQMDKVRDRSIKRYIEEAESLISKVYFNYPQKSLLYTSFPKIKTNEITLHLPFFRYAYQQSDFNNNQIPVQLMKTPTTYLQLKKARTAKPTKKSSLTHSLIYKQINNHLNEAAAKIKPSRDSKETIMLKQRKESTNDDKLIPSKKSSIHQLIKKSSKVDLTQITFQHIYQKLSDNFMVDKQEENKFQLEDTKHLAYQRQKKDSKETVATSSEIHRSSKFNKIEIVENPKVEKNLFGYQYIIGKGGFGKVWKVEHKKTKNQFAMKQMLKSIVMSKKSVQSVMNQRVLLSQFHSPFVVNMHYAFQDRDTLYLVLDLMEGGDLRYHIGNRIFNQMQSKFFIACIILGLEDLHKNSIIHRDIKPENLVLDSRGYIRITDLGIARLYKPNNSCDTSGTPGYMSPEVICRMNHSYVSDYFAVGVIAYELMTCKRPYNGRSRNEIRDLMLAKEVQIKYAEIPDEWSCEAADFINKLIKRKPENRLGFGGIHELKNHPWLDGLHWQKLRSKDIESPFVPMMKKSHFDQDEQITIQDQQEAELIEKNSLLLRKPEFQQLFNSYYYSHFEPSAQVATAQVQKKTIIKKGVTAYRKSSQQQKEIRMSQLLPQKKLSYNQSNIQRRRIDLPQNLQKKPKNHELSELGKQKKRSIQYQKTFFR